MTESIGVWGLATVFPETVRTNADWPADVATRFAARAQSDITTLGQGFDPLLAKVMAPYRDDPFRGAVTRRVLAPGELPSQLEARAAAMALERAEVSASEVDLLLSFSAVADALGLGNSGALQARLGLRSDTLCVNIDSACNSHAVGWELACALLKSGRARRALVVTSSCFSPINDLGDPSSVCLGDAASASVLGPVALGFGLLASHLWTDGSVRGALEFASGEGAWYRGGGPISVRMKDPQQAKLLVTRLSGYVKESVEGVLRKSIVAREQLGFFAVHQATAWFTTLAREVTGLYGLDFIDTFPQLGNVGASNVPWAIEGGLKSGSVKRGTYILTFSMGGGVHGGSMIMRWGR
jgi:3-oxoacyl-[acyl-carrier-protein] synthase III